MKKNPYTLPTGCLEWAVYVELIRLYDHHTVRRAITGGTFW